MPKKEIDDVIYDLYISYNPKQKEQVDYVCKLFKEANLNIWYDQEHINNTNDDNKFDSNLHALQSSYIFVCFLSKDYQKCIKNRIEYSIAKEQNKKVINIYLNDFKTEFNEKRNKEDFSFNGESMHELSKNIKIIKEEAETISKTFKQSFKKLVNNWYKSIA